jgi:hypothetical protein
MLPKRKEKILSLDCDKLSMYGIISKIMTKKIKQFVTPKQEVGKNRLIRNTQKLYKNKHK